MAELNKKLKAFHKTSCTCIINTYQQQTSQQHYGSNFIRSSARVLHVHGDQVGQLDSV